MILILKILLNFVQIKEHSPEVVGLIVEDLEFFCKHRRDIVIASMEIHHDR